MEKRTNTLERDRWADELIKRLPKEEQIKWLIEKLANPSRDGEDELDLLEGLKIVFEDNVAFRKQLCHIYDQVIAAVFPKLGTAIAKKILEGWDWKWGEYGDWKTPEYHKRAKRTLQINPDARDCFQFFCQVYKSGSEQFQKLLMEVLHEHINTHRARGYGSDYDWAWRAQDLNEWILAEGVPNDIKVVLASARVRIIGSQGTVQREISLSHSFQTQARSSDAIELFRKEAELIRRTEELVEAFVYQVQPTDRYGALNPESHLPTWVKFEWKLESAEVARVKITFRRAADPKSIADVQTVRDQLLSKIENPPRILIEVEGPDGFSYKEENKN